jgi:integrase
VSETDWTKERLFTTVKETTALAKRANIGQRDAEQSAATLADYAKVGRQRIDLSQDGGGQLMSGVSRQSWNKVRAALLHETDRLCREQRRICDVAQRAWRAAQKAGDRVAAQEAFDVACEAATAANRAARASWAVQTAYPPAERSAAKKTKRKTIPKGTNWRRALFDAASPTMKGSILALWCGARPAEIEKGVEIILRRKNAKTMVRVRVRGAKITKNSGQEQRDLFFDDPTSELAKLLAEHCMRTAAPFEKVDGNGVRETFFKTTVKRSAKRIGKDFTKWQADGVVPKQVSAYTLRHAFRSDLDADGWPKKQVAEMMGHRSERSQGNYGHLNLGVAGGLGLKAIAATNEVRTEWNRGRLVKTDAGHRFVSGLDEWLDPALESGKLSWL